MYARSSWVRAASFLPVLFVVGLFLVEGFVYEYVYCHYILSLHRNKAALGSVYGAIFAVLWVLGFWSYLASVFYDPGTLPDTWFSLLRVQDVPLAMNGRGWRPSLATSCLNCQEKRPERAHHCSVCGRCILRMDHHCPWIANCVGFGNHKQFMLLGFWGSLAAIFFGLTALPDFMRGFAYGGIIVPPGEHGESLGWMTLFLFSACMAYALAFGLQVLFWAHVSLLWGNTTSIEAGYHGENPYCLGPRRNFEQVFGVMHWTWLLPIRPLHPVSDGLSYPTNLSSPPVSPPCGSPPHEAGGKQTGSPLRHPANERDVEAGGRSVQRMDANQEHRDSTAYSSSVAGREIGGSTRESLLGNAVQTEV